MSDEKQDQVDGVAGGKGECLDLDDPKTRRLLGRAARRRWPLSDEVRKLVLDRTITALRQADSSRDISQLAKIVVQMEGQNQADDHLEDKNARMDDGKPTEVQRVYKVEFDE